MTLARHAPGSTWCECVACGEGFAGLRLFERHRVGSPGEHRCLAADEMTACGWHRDPRGLWRDAGMASGGAREGLRRRRTSERGSQAGVAA